MNVMTPDHSHTSLDWPKLKDILASFATSETAKAALLNLTLFDQQSQAERSHQAIQFAVELLELDKRPSFESLDTCSMWMSRIAKSATLDPLLLKDARLFFREAVAARTLFEEAQIIGLSTATDRWVREFLSEVADFRKILAAIDAVITPSGDLREDASPALKDLYREKASQTQRLQNTLDRLVRSHEMETFVQDRFVTTREGRWVIPLKSGMKPFVPGLVHGASQSKQTVYLEPEETVPINNRLRELETAIEAEIERILVDLSKQIGREERHLTNAQIAFQRLDLNFAKAQLARQTDASAPIFTDSEIDFKNLKNPLMVASGKSVIGNSVSLGSHTGKSVLLLSGPNAGGKTVLLKSIGLASVMAKAGLWISADPGSKVIFFEQIQSTIGDEQSVDQDLSTFAAHLKALNSGAALSGHRSLLLIDEICGSTDPEEGSALARAFIDRFVHQQIYCVVTSHLQSLKQGWPSESRVLNGSLDFDTKKGQPTYRFLSGVPGQSMAIQTAERVGIDPSLIADARAHLSPETRARIDLMRELEDVRDELRKKQTDLVHETMEMTKERGKYRELVHLFKTERNKWLEKFIDKTEKKIDHLISQYSVDQLFRKHERIQDIKAELPTIVKHQSPKSEGGRSNSAQPQTAEAFAERFPPGSKVFVTSLKSDGVVQTKPNAKGEVQILAKSMRLSVQWSSLFAAHAPENPTLHALRRTSGVTVSAVDTERVVDVRGLTPDDALAKLEREIDSALLSEETRFRVVHGHGTETLKRAIRSYLSRSTNIASWKSGGTSGGDGVTIVIL